MKQLSDDEELLALKPVEVTELLENIPGGDNNLLPVSATLQDLEVIVPMWPVSEPYPGEPEVLQLFWDEELVVERSWEAPVPPEDLKLSVPKEKLTHGAHELRYKVIDADCDASYSDVLQVLIDLQGPVLGGAGDTDSGRRPGRGRAGWGHGALPEKPPTTPANSGACICHA